MVMVPQQEVDTPTGQFGMFLQCLDQPEALGHSRTLVAGFKVDLHGFRVSPAGALRRQKTWDADKRSDRARS